MSDLKKVKKWLAQWSSVFFNMVGPIEKFEITVALPRQTKQFFAPVLAEVFNFILSIFTLSKDLPAAILSLIHKVGDINSLIVDSYRCFPFSQKVSKK